MYVIRSVCMYMYVCSRVPHLIASSRRPADWRTSTKSVNWMDDRRPGGSFARPAPTPAHPVEILPGLRNHHDSCAGDIYGACACFTIPESPDKVSTAQLRLFPPGQLPGTCAGCAHYRSKGQLIFQCHLHCTCRISRGWLWVNDFARHRIQKRSGGPANLASAALVRLALGNPSALGLTEKVDSTKPRPCLPDQ